MVSLSRQLNKLLIGLLLLAVPVEAYIPKEEFPLQISPSRQELIKMGYAAPYNERTVQRVIIGKAKIMPNGAILQLPHGRNFVPSLPQLLFDPKLQENGEMRSSKEIEEFFGIEPDLEYASREPIDLDLKFDPIVSYSDEQIQMINRIFWTAQVLDVYSTYKGLKYDCIYEKNPLLDPIPKVHEMVGLKLGIIYLMDSIWKNEPEWKHNWRLITGISTGLVTANNFRLLNKAKKECNRR